MLGKLNQLMTRPLFGDHFAPIQVFARRVFKVEDIDETERVWVGGRSVAVPLRQGGRFEVAAKMSEVALALLRTGRMVPPVADETVGRAVLEATVPGVRIVKDYDRHCLIGVTPEPVGEILMGPGAPNPDGTIRLRIGYWVDAKRIVVVPVRKPLSCFGFTP